MLASVWDRLTLRVRSDSGLGMILVIGIVIFVAGVTATAGVVTMNGLGQSRHRISYEQALASAESGIDFSLGKLQYAFDTAFADYPIPSPSAAPTAACTASSVQLPTEANDPATWDEEAWAEARLDALEQAPVASGRPACLLSTPTGDVLVLKPRNATGGPGLKYGRVYARGWSPRWGHPNAVERTIKVEYVFMPFRPQHAVLTGSDLSLQGSFLVDEANGVDPDTAGVHTNGDLDLEGSGGDVSGPVTFIGELDGSATFSSGEPAQAVTPVRIPAISALQLYRQAPSRDSVDPTVWRDLCHTNGVPSVHVYSTAGPCMGPVHEGGTGGWSFSGTTPATYTWTANRDTLDGTYFVHHANARNGTGNPDFSSITVIASATAPASPGNCPSPRYGGNIIWDHYAVGVPSFSDLWFLADQDLLVHANFDAGSNGDEPIAGTYIAGEEIDLQTSSSMLVGSVLAGNQCPDDNGPVDNDENNIQGQQIWFKPNADSPFSSVVSTTLWLEY